MDDVIGADADDVRFLQETRSEDVVTTAEPVEGARFTFGNFVHPIMQRLRHAEPLGCRSHQCVSVAAQRLLLPHGVTERQGPIAWFAAIYTVRQGRYDAALATDLAADEVLACFRTAAPARQQCSPRD